MAKQTLFWFSFSLEPLSLKEVGEAVITSENEVVVNDGTRLLRPKTLLQDCSSLITYNPTITRMSLAHSSVRNYLTSQEIQTSDVSEFYLNETTADAAISARCINYLCLPAFRSGYCPTHATLAQRFDDWPLLPYIAETLFDHLSYVTLDKQS